MAPAQSRRITEFDEFTGRFAAVERVEIRPRVSGYISQVHFPEGRRLDFALTGTTTYPTGVVGMHYARKP